MGLGGGDERFRVAGPGASGSEWGQGVGFRVQDCRVRASFDSHGRRGRHFSIKADSFDFVFAAEVSGF